MPKADADYASKLDQAELIRDGLEARWVRQFDAFETLIGEHEKKPELMQMFAQACSTRAGLDATIELVERYKRLVAAQAAKRDAPAPAPAPAPPPAEPRAHARAK